MTNEERDRAIRILQWLHNNNFLFRSTEEDVKFATEYAIKALEQEPKIGHWVNLNKDNIGRCDDYGSPYVECSICHEYNDTEQTDYCPHCGCRMVEPQESEDKE